MVNEWTRDDLPPVAEAVAAYLRGRGPSPSMTDALSLPGIHGVLDAVVDLLNAHHPRPEQSVCAQSDNDEPNPHSPILIEDGRKKLYVEDDTLKINTVLQDNDKTEIPAAPPVALTYFQRIALAKALVHNIPLSELSLYGIELPKRREEERRKGISPLTGHQNCVPVPAPDETLRDAETRRSSEVGPDEVWWIRSPYGGGEDWLAVRSCPEESHPWVAMTAHEQLPKAALTDQMVTLSRQLHEAPQDLEAAKKQIAALESSNEILANTLEDLEKRHAEWEDTFLDEINNPDERLLEMDEDRIIANIERNRAQRALAKMEKRLAQVEKQLKSREDDHR